MSLIQVITLEGQQKKQLESMLKRGRWTPRELVRARILLMANDRKNSSNQDIADELKCAREKVREVRKRFLGEGLETALSERPRSGQPKKLNHEDGAFIIATACSESPQGTDHWTLSMLASRLDHYRGKKVSTEPIRHLLLASELKPWLKKNVVCGENQP